MTMSPSVSVVMPVLNPHPVHFREAVQSVLAQTLTDLELIVVEDPSPVSGRELLADVSDPRLRHHCNPARTGLVAQRNQCLALARSPWVALLDADDICEPSRLERQLAYLDAHPHVDVLGSQLTIIDDQSRVTGYRVYPQTHASIAAAMKRGNPIANSSAVFQLDRTRAAGGYRYDRHPGVEDYDLWSRLLLAGAVFANHPQPLVRYRIHTGQIKHHRLRGQLRGTLDIKKAYWRSRFGVRNRVRFWAEYSLLWLPPSLVLRLFQALEYGRSKPPIPVSLATPRPPVLHREH